VEPALVYFAKAPLPGTVKTRLCPPLTPAQAASLYQAMLQDVLAGAQPKAVRSFVYGWPPAELAALESLVPRGLPVRPQHGVDLGERMARCFAELFAAGHMPIVLRNTDSPDLPAPFVEQAFEALRGAHADVVLGPDRGGGYYLVGLRQPAAELFVGQPMGGATVFAETCARAEALGMEVLTLQVHDDVDRVDDLRRLQARGAPPHSARWLAEHAGVV
jgi:rSAM/selenodomain-associated transferase 1